MSLGIVLDCADPEQLAGFWARALRYRAGPYQPPYVILRPEAGDGPKFVLQRVPEPKQAKNRMHLDLWVADIEADPLEEIGSRWIVMADPEGNEFCLCQEAKSPPAAPTR